MDCELCFEEYNRSEYMPKVLKKCGHTFCESCIAKIIGTKGILKCPFCRYEMSYTSADTPPTNFALLSAIELVKEEREKKGISRYYKPNYQVS